MTRRLLILIVVCVLAAAGLMGRRSTATAAAAPDLQAPITWTFGDVLALYEDVLALQMNSALPEKADKFEGVRLILADGRGQTTLVLQIAASGIAKVQSQSPGEQMKTLAKLRTVFYEVFTRIAGGEVAPEAFGTLYKDLFPVRPVAAAVNAYIASRTPQQFEMRVGFLQDGKVHLYATATEQGVTFSPDAPRAR